MTKVYTEAERSQCAGFPIKRVTATSNSLSPSSTMFNSLLTPSSSHIFSPCIVAKTFLLCFILRNSRNQMPCQVPVASFPFDMGTLTLAPIRDDLMCACPIAQSAIRPHEEISGSSIPAYHHSPLHRAYRSPSQLPMQFVSQRAP